MSNPVDTKDANAHSSQEVAKVTVKIPPFWKANPVLWFAQIESQFQTARITGDATKFHTVVASIESDVLALVSDVVITPPQANMYETLKQRLIQQFADSEQKRLKKLLQDIDLGDRKPSELLREMRELAGNNVIGEGLKSIWMQRLPDQMKIILSANEGNIEQLAKMADKISEVATLSYVSEASSSGPSTRRNDDRTAKLEKKI